MKAHVISNWWMILVNLIVLSIAVVILAACGGGSAGDSGSSITGLSSGEIEGFGSVIINGVKFEVEGAEVEFEHGQTVIITSGTQTQHLHEGMHIEVEGSFDDNGQTGTATRIIVDDALEGEVSGLATNANTGVVTFTILGQTVVAVPGVTQVEDTELNGLLSNLASGDFVEVHGLPDGNGTIQATFIEWKAANLTDFNNLPGNEGEFEVTGAITSLGAGSQFNIGTLLVDYTGVTPDGPLAVGTLLEVKGTYDGTSLSASIVHVEDGVDNDVAKIEIEGLIRNLDNPVNGQFTLNGQVVDYTLATFFGGIEADLVNGLKVEAEGPVVSGVLVATKVKFKDSFRYEGMVTEGANQLSISVPSPAGNLTVLIDSSISEVEGGLVYATDPVKIRARIVSGSTLIATRVRSGGNNDRQIFEGPVVAFSQGANSVEILDDGTQSGVGVIDVNTSTINESPPSDFEIEGVPVPKATFYGSLNVNDRIKARYRNGEWDQIEIEIED